MKICQLGIAAMVFAFATGFTDCTWFSEVTVPATDTTPPTIWNSVLVNGEHKMLTPGSDRFDWRVAPGETVVAVGAGSDPGGTHKVTMFGGSTLRCCEGSICEVSSSSSVVQPQIQPGGVGDTVSNGVWAYEIVEAPKCGRRATRGSFSYGWSTEVEDFHGNKARGGGGTIHYSFP